jgi:hypothetical protein
MIRKALDEGKKQEVKEKLLEQAKQNSWEIRAEDIIKRLSK